MSASLCGTTSKQSGLQRHELDAYLTHRFRPAGCELPIFEPPAAELLFQNARGLPQRFPR